MSPEYVLYLMIAVYVAFGLVGSIIAIIDDKDRSTWWRQAILLGLIWGPIWFCAALGVLMEERADRKKKITKENQDVVL